MAFGVPPLSWLAKLPVLNLIWWSKYQAASALAVAVLAGFGAHHSRLRGWTRWLPAVVIAGELGLLVPRPWTTWDCFEQRADGMLSLARIGATPTRRDERWYGLGRWPMPHPLASIGLRDARTYFGLYPRRAYWYMRALVTGPAQTANEAVFTGPVRPLLPHADRALKALAVRWIVAGPYPVSRPPAGVRTVPAEGPIRVYELPGSRSRARMVRQAVRVTDAATALTNTSVDPAGDTAFVEGPGDWIGFHVTGTPGRAAIVADRGSVVDVEVPGSGPRVLLLADTFEPGWRADAGRFRLRVLPANCMFRIVAVPPTGRTVRFTYDPMPLKVGLLASGLGLGWLAGLLLPVAAPHRRGRRR
jgi:hypothetical protein